ncbi:hypothetical protein BDV93DRAFT_120593 [Ceratobasidium sp. AG-I]|nr:hypothetical protein BDV93DRAFT_120593 [Ceratobasidium sp. AG-I]
MYMSTAMESPSMDPSEPFSKSSGETSSQSASEGSSSLDQGDAQEWLANDLVSQEVCPIERLLKAFVIRCKDIDLTPPTRFPSGSTKTGKASTMLSISPGASSQPDSTLAATDSDSSDDALFERCLEAARHICDLPQMRSLFTE